MKLCRSLAALTLAVLIVLAPALTRAQLIVYNQAPTYPGGFNTWTSTYDPTTYGYIYADFDQFQLSSSAQVTGLTFQGFTFDVSTLGPATNPVNGFDIFFWTDNSNYPGNILSNDFVAGTGDETYVGSSDLFGNGNQENIYNYQVSLTSPVTLAANTPYWLTIIGSMNYPSYWSWMSGFGAAGYTIQESFYPNNIVYRPGDRAFALTVPEPGACALLVGLGLTGFAFLRRRAC
jgi:hypothetical protein